RLPRSFSSCAADTGSGRRSDQVTTPGSSQTPGCDYLGQCLEYKLCTRLPQHERFSFESSRHTFSVPALVAATSCVVLHSVIFSMQTTLTNRLLAKQREALIIGSEASQLHPATRR